jgi:hypothetical protein
MDIDIPPPPRRAFGRAWEDFEPTATEEKLAEAARVGEICELGLAAPKTGEASNTIRAEFLRFLALGGDARAPMHEKGLRLRGAFVEGALDLEGAELPFDLLPIFCSFVQPITFRGAHGRTINLHGSHLNGLSADGLRLDGALFLRHVQATGEMRLLGAQITGNLECDQGQFKNPGGFALVCDRVEIGGSVFLRAEFHATGATRLLGARITGDLDCTKGYFDNAGGAALSCDGAEIGGGVLLSNGFHATGETRLLDARISGNLDCTGGRVNNARGGALVCDRVEVGGSVLLRAKFHATGGTNLIGARITRDLDCTKGCFDNAGGAALSCNGAEIGGRMLLSDGFHAIGATLLFGARIAGDFSCNGARFDNAGGAALSCDRAEIGGGVFLSNDFHASGETRLPSARITGELNCDGGRFDNTGGYALNLASAKIGGAVFFRAKLHATGQTNLVGARITGDLDCSNGRFDNADGDTLICDGAEIGGGLFFRGKTAAQGRVSFAHAQVGALADASECWPNRSLDLDGFRYQRISATAPLDAKTRIAWLDKQMPRFLEGKNFALQPWTHLANVLREQGHFSEAAEVDIAREDRLRKAGRIAPLPSPRRWWAGVATPKNLRELGDFALSIWAEAKLLPNFIFRPLHRAYGLLAGYGFKPRRVIIIAFFAWLVFAAFYDYAASWAVFGPSNASVFQNKAYEHCRPEAPDKPENGKKKIGNWTRCPELPGEYTSFSPLAYSADLILPVVSLGQSNDWAPITSGESLGYATRLAVWFEELFGWVAALTLAAIASGLVKRKDGD